MARRMLIDATHPEETRVVVVSGNRLEEFDYDTVVFVKHPRTGSKIKATAKCLQPSLNDGKSFQASLV